MSKLHWLGRGYFQVYNGDTDSLLFKGKTDKLLHDLENGVHITSRMDYTNWNESIYTELVKHKASNNIIVSTIQDGERINFPQCSCRSESVLCANSQ